MSTLNSYFANALERARINCIGGLEGRQLCSVYEWENGKFQFASDCKKVFGIEEEHFNRFSLKNKGPIEFWLLHPDDIIHFKRYNYVARNLVSNDDSLLSLNDAFQITARMRVHGHFRAVRRTCQFIRDSGNEVIGQLDTWNVEEQSDNFVNPGFVFISDRIENEFACQNKFFKKNLEILGLDKFNELDHKILAGISEITDIKILSAELGMRKTQLDEHLRTLRKKIWKEVLLYVQSSAVGPYMVHFSKKEFWKRPSITTTEMAHLCREFGLLIPTQK